MRRILNFIAITAALLLPSLAHAQATQPSRFPIFCFAQDASTLATWAQRGVTDELGGPNPTPNVSRAQFYAAGQAAGIKVWLAPDPAGVQNDLAQAACGGFLGDDEPEGWGNLGNPITAASVQAYVNSYVSRLQAALKAKPSAAVFGNFTANLVYSGTAFSGNQPFTVGDYQQCCAVLSITSIDRYLRNNGLAVTTWPQQVTPALQRLKQISGGKSLCVFIETSNQGNISGGTGPTAAEFENQVWEGIVDGCQSIAYFSHQFAPTFTCDGTPADVAARMTRVDAELLALGPSLILPGGAVTTTGNVRSSTRGAYTIAVNCSAAAATFQGHAIEALGAIVLKGDAVVYASAAGATGATPAPPTSTPAPATPALTPQQQLDAVNGQITALKLQLAGLQSQASTLSKQIAAAKKRK